MVITVNGRRRTVTAHPMKRLLDVLREDCGLTGTKEGCGEGECGACTVLIDGLAVDSCIVPVAHAEGRKVITIEGAAKTRTGKALQNAFVEHGGAQCGICTPGMILAAAPLKRGATLQDIKTISPGICAAARLSEHLSFGRCRAQSQPASPKRERRREGKRAGTR